MAKTSVPLSTRLFRARLEMIGELDKRVTAGSHLAEPRATFSDPLDDEQLRGELAGFLHQQVAAMNLDNFVVRPQRKSVEKFAKLESWHKLDSDSLHELRQQVADLPTGLLDNDEEARLYE